MNVSSIVGWLETTAISYLGMVFAASSVLCATGWLLSVLLNRRSAAVRFGVWQIAICGIVVSAFMIVTFDGIPLGIATPVIGETESMTIESRSVADRVETGRLTKETKGTKDIVKSSVNKPAVRQSATAKSRRTRFSLGAFVAVTGLMFTTLMLTRLILSAMHAHRIVRMARPIDSTVVQDALQVARTRMGISDARVVRICQTDELDVPFTLGVFRSVIVLPSEALDWPIVKLEMVLAHELAHVLRRDVLSHWLSRLSYCIAGFNPLTWLAQRRCVFERERACDDRVLEAGYRATDYGQSLLEVASAMRGRRGMLLIGVSMAYPDFRRRLETVLDRKVDRRPLPKRWILPLVALFLVLTIVAGSLRPFDARVIAAEPPPKADGTPMTATPVQKQDSNWALIRGFVTDWNGQPISGASVFAELQRSAGDDPTPKQSLPSWKAFTDKLGAYEIDAVPIDTLSSHPRIRIRTSADGFTTSDYSWSGTKEELAIGERIGPIKLWKGKNVLGRVIGSNGRPIAGHIFAAGHDGDPNRNWWQNGKIAIDGRFDLIAPREMDFELLVFGKDHAPVRVFVERNVSNLADINVVRGKVVAGRLLNREDLPVPGVVIAMTSLENSKLGGLSFDAESATITDAEGKFKLPPTSGECHIWAAVSAASMESGQTVKEGIKPPPVVPITVDLAENDAVSEITIVLKEADVVEMSGTARWENGDPVAGLEVKAGDGNANLATVKTDADGKYQLTIPKAVHVLYLMAVGAKNREGLWHMAHGEYDGVPSFHPQIQEFNDLIEDKQDVDWVLKPRKK